MVNLLNIYNSDKQSVIDFVKDYLYKSIDNASLYKPRNDRY